MKGRKSVVLILVVTLVSIITAIAYADQCNGSVTVSSNVYAPIQVELFSGNAIASPATAELSKRGTVSFKFSGQSGDTITIRAKSPTRRAETYRGSSTLPFDKCTYVITLEGTNDLIIQ